MEWKKDKFFEPKQGRWEDYLKAVWVALLVFFSNLLNFDL